MNDKTQSNNTANKVKEKISDQFKLDEANPYIEASRQSDNTKDNDTKEKTIEAKKIGVKPVKPIPSELNTQYVIQGDEIKGKYYFKDKPELEAFRDKGAKLITKSTASSVAKSMVALAESKQWESIKLSGSDKFKREVWMEAKLRGMEVDGYKPSKQDLQNLEAKQNKIEHSEKSSDKNVVSKPPLEKEVINKNNVKSINSTNTNKEKAVKESNIDKSIPEKRTKVWKEESFIDEKKQKTETSKADAKVLEIRNRLDQADKDKANIAKFLPPTTKSSIKEQTSTPSDNTISKEREKKDELRKAYNELSKQEAIKKFPGLEPLYNLEKAAQQFVEHGSNKDKFDDKGKERFISKIRENSLDTLSKGQSLPTIKERVTPEKTSEKETEIAR